MDIPEETRRTVAAGLADWMLTMEAKAKMDSDPVSIEGFTGDDGEPLGGLFLVRTPEAFRVLAKCAADNGLITKGKGIVDGTETNGELF